VPIAEGDSVYLSYVSANRDEDVFDEPFRFDVSRDPNKHLAFGYGVHFCLGAALARMEISSFFHELLPRLKSIELNGEPELIATTFVGALSTCRFVARCGSTGGLRALNVQETVDGGARTLSVVELRQRRQPAQHQRTDQQRDGAGSIDLTQLGRLRAIEYGVERRSVLLGDAFAQRCDRGTLRRALVMGRWQFF